MTVKNKNEKYYWPRKKSKKNSSIKLTNLQSSDRFTYQLNCASVCVCSNMLERENQKKL